MDYTELAAEVTRRAKSLGADECDCLLEVGRELTVKVRQGQVESIERADFRGLGIRIFINKALGFGFTTDFSKSSIDDLMERSRAFALKATPDPDSGMPEFGPADTEDLDLSDPEIDDTSLAEKTGLALACEQAAYDHDKRIKYTYGTSYSDRKGKSILARIGADPIVHEGTYVDLTCVPVAEAEGEKRMGIWLSAERFLSDLEPAAAVGTVAAQRAVAMLGAATVPTQKAAVVFDQRTGSQVVANVFESLDGERIVQGTTFLRDRIGDKVGSDVASFVDDGRMTRRIGPRLFDSEGTPTRRTLAIDKGTVKSYFYDYRSAKKAGADPTGNASRGFASIPSVGANNFYLIPGKAAREDVIARIDSGLLVTNLLGFGVNITTGDYSRGAEGMWIRDGKISHPVHGVTIAGKLQDMLKDLEAVASDLRFFGRIGSPTFIIREMTIAGE